MAFGLLFLYCIFLFWAGTNIPDLYPPLSDDPSLAVEQILKRVEHSAWFATLANVPLALAVGWACANSLKTRKWPALGHYVPFKLKVRTLNSTWRIWLLLGVVEANFILVAVMAWWHYYKVREMWACYGVLPSG